MWRIGWAPNNASRWQMGFNSAFKGLKIRCLNNTAIYVFLLLCLFILIVCLCIIIVPAGTLRLQWLRIFHAFFSVVRQMPVYNLQRRSTARILPKSFVLFYVLFVLYRSVYCLCVNVYFTTSTGWQPNCSLTNISYIISAYRIKLYRTPEILWITRHVESLYNLVKFTAVREKTINYILIYYYTGVWRPVSTFRVFYCPLSQGALKLIYQSK
jgi:hypothetical protein